MAEAWNRARRENLLIEQREGLLKAHLLQSAMMYLIIIEQHHRQSKGLHIGSFVVPWACSVPFTD